MAITVFAILIFIPNIDYPIYFAAVALLACMLVDIDSYYSYVGNVAIFRPLQIFTKHRGMIHSITLAVILSILLLFLSPKIALPFFVGYGLHVFVDSFTLEGVMPFWPYKGESKGIMHTGKHSESVIFFFFVLLDLFMAFVVFF